jgi:hypothetical protein
MLGEAPVRDIARVLSRKAARQYQPLLLATVQSHLSVARDVF